MSGIPRCPNNDGDLRPVKAPGKHGQVILLDQCGQCGGIWFDKWELFQVDESKAATIGSLDVASLRYPRGFVGEPLCPRCRARLKKFHDNQIPENIQMWFCTRCEGFWLNHGELTGYAEFRLSRHLASDARVAERYENILKYQSDKVYWEGLERFGHELGAQRDFLTGFPLDGTPEQLARIDAAQDLFYAMLGTVARLLFGWL